MQASVRSEFVNSATALTVKQDTTKKSEKNLKRKEKIGLSPHITSFMDIQSNDVIRSMVIHQDTSQGAKRIKVQSIMFPIMRVTTMISLITTNLEMSSRI